MRREHDERSRRRVLLALDEDGAAALEVADDVRVMNDLAADVDGRPVQLQRSLDGLDSPFDASAIPARRGKKQPRNHRARW